MSIEEMIMNISKAQKDFLQSIGTNSPNTVRSHRLALREFVDHYREALIDDMTKADLEGYVKMLGEQGKHPIVINGRIDSIKAFFLWRQS